VWGATVLVAMTAAFLTSLVAYGVIFADARVDGLGRFWHSVYEGQEVVLWGVLVGLPAGVLAALLVGGVDRRPGYVMSSTLTTTDPMWTAQLATPAPVQVVTVAPAPSGQLAYVTAPVITGVAAAPVVAAPVPLVPPPPVPVSEPTVVMVQRGPAPPPSPTVSAPPDSTEN
jgi:hypothetical protein